MNAALTIELAAGSYQVWATSYGPGELGAYELSLELTDPGSTMAPDLAAEAEGKGAVPDARGAPTPFWPAPWQPPTRMPPSAFYPNADKAEVPPGMR